MTDLQRHLLFINKQIYEQGYNLFPPLPSSYQLVMQGEKKQQQQQQQQQQHHLDVLKLFQQSTPWLLQEGRWNLSSTLIFRTLKVFDEFKEISYFL